MLLHHYPAHYMHHAYTKGKYPEDSFLMNDSLFFHHFFFIFPLIFLYFLKIPLPFCYPFQTGADQFSEKKKWTKQDIIQCKQDIIQ